MFVLPCSILATVADLQAPAHGGRVLALVVEQLGQRELEHGKVMHVGPLL